MTARARGRVRIGITGPIGCGKSQVAAWLGERGALVVDADRVARDVDGPGLARSTPRSCAGSAPRSRLPTGRSTGRRWAGSCSRDPAALRDLEALVHPAVRPRILDAIEAAEAYGHPAVVIEAIKLVEGGLAGAAATRSGW